MGDLRPGHGRYAHIEREQRWLCDAVPHGAVPVCSLVDRYIDQTRLRLRRSETSDGVVYKLGQKVRPVAADPETVSLTNIYLSDDEHTTLLALPAAELRKTRSHVEWCGRTIAVDRFLGRLAGLILAEVELAPDDAQLDRPPWALRDVTNDDRFSGGTLARASDEAIAELLGHRDRPAG